MVNIETGLAINTPVAADRTKASAFRRIFGAMLRRDQEGEVIPGVLYGPGDPLRVSTDAAVMQYKVNAGHAVTTRDNQGAYIVGHPSDVLVPTSVGHATYARIDRIYIVQPDPELSETGHARIDVEKGTPSASPQLPNLPAGALELGRKLVPAGASNTATGDPLTNFPDYTSVAVAWDSISGLPTAFIPAPHTHVIADVDGLQTALNGKASASSVTTLSSTVGTHTTRLAAITPQKITVQTQATADPVAGNTVNDLLIER